MVEVFSLVSLVNLVNLGLCSRLVVVMGCVLRVWVGAVWVLMGV